MKIFGIIGGVCWGPVLLLQIDSIFIELATTIPALALLGWLVHHWSVEQQTSQTRFIEHLEKRDKLLGEAVIENTRMLGQVHQSLETFTSRAACLVGKKK